MDVKGWSKTHKHGVNGLKQSRLIFRSNQKDGAVRALVGACGLRHSHGNFPVGGPGECAQVVPAVLPPVASQVLPVECKAGALRCFKDALTQHRTSSEGRVLPLPPALHVPSTFPALPSRMLNPGTLNGYSSKHSSVSIDFGVPT